MLPQSPSSGKQTFHAEMHHRKAKSTEVTTNALSLKVEKTNITPLIRVAIWSDFCFHVSFLKLKF